MTEHEGPMTDDAAQQAEEPPQRVDRRTWVTLGLFAVFFIAFATCANQFLFR